MADNQPPDRPPPSPQPPPLPPDPRPPIPLEYATPNLERRRKEWSPFAKQLMIGFASFCIASVIGIIVTAALNPAAATLRDGLMAPSLALVLCLISGGILHFRFGWHGFLVGVLIGAGLMMLGLGLCLGMLFG